MKSGMKTIALAGIACAAILHASWAGETGAKKEILSGLKGPSCREPLDADSCRTATEMKGYVQALLDLGLSRDEIFYRTARKYSLEAVIDEQARGNVKARLVKEIGAAYPELKTEPVLFNFGKVGIRSGRVTAPFTLRNDGTAPLNIEEIRALCSCTSFSLIAGGKKSPVFGRAGLPAEWKIQIPPGNTAVLEAGFDPSDQGLGTVAREIEIISNDPLKPVKRIRLQAEVVE